MYTRTDITKEIDSLYALINGAQVELEMARAEKDHNREMAALYTMEKHLRGIKKDLAIFRTEMQENPFLTWQDVRQIVELADAIIHPAPERGWTQEKYYRKILKHYEISTENSEA